MFVVHERRILRAVWVLDLVDAYLQSRGVQGPHPRPFGPLRFWYVGQMVGGVRRELAQPLEMRMTRNASGYDLFFDEVMEPVRRGEGPMIRRLGLTDGLHIVRVTSPFYQTEEFTDLVPLADVARSLVMQPGPGYPFPDPYPILASSVAGNCADPGLSGRRGPTLLRGSLHQADGTPVTDATIEVANSNPLRICRVDDTGQWLLWFDDAQQTASVSLVIRPAGTVIPGVCVIRGRETSLSETALRGWVLRAGRPVRGAVVQVDGLVPTAITDASGAWSYYFPPNQPQIDVSVTATLAAGGPASVPQNVTVIPRTTQVVPTFTFN